MAEPTVFFTRTEIESYLPTGWLLVDGDAEPRRRGGAWAARVLDGADTEWRLEIRTADLEKHGRLAALQRAMDRVYREALG